MVSAKIDYMSTPPRPKRVFPNRASVLRGLVLVAFLCFVYTVFRFANPDAPYFYDYQFRVAKAILHHGELGLREDVSWLNELVPFENRFYTVFPLGSVVCHMPLVALQDMRKNEDCPTVVTTAVLAMFIAWFATLLSRRYGDSLPRRALFVVWLVFGSWAFVNMTMANGWQIAMTLSLFGQLGAMVLILHDRSPLLAGVLFAIAYGNRTEIILTAPLYMYLMVRYDPFRNRNEGEPGEPFLRRVRRQFGDLLLFCVFPTVLGLATLWYNNARFHNPLDFGYARITYQHLEYWYKYGFWSLQAIPLNIRAILFSSSWDVVRDFPYVKPALKGGSIISASPFLLLLIRPGSRDIVLRRVSWTAVILLTVALILHADPGGNQFSYRYEIVSLPWIWLLLLDRRGGRVSLWEWGLLALGIISNAWATYTYFWTHYVW
ncbi:MAG: hypothetical protein H8F28_03855 [Fibrella sp.]|nr:hypothetical protein [Armatimonadota bacterium]